jgi:hypothetical protein
LIAAYNAFRQIERFPEMGWRRAFNAPGLEHVRVRRVAGFRQYLHAAQDIRRVLER